MYGTPWGAHCQQGVPISHATLSMWWIPLGWKLCNVSYICKYCDAVPSHHYSWVHGVGRLYNCVIQPHEMIMQCACVQDKMRTMAPKRGRNNIRVLTRLGMGGQATEVPSSRFQAVLCWPYNSLAATPARQFGVSTALTRRRCTWCSTSRVKWGFKGPRWDKLFSGSGALGLT